MSPEHVHQTRKERDESVSGTDTAHVQAVRVDLSERVLSIIAIIMATAAFVISFWAQSDNTRLREELVKAERESRVLQQQVMDQSALLLREGIRQPGDETNGPAANFDYHRRK